LGVKTKLLIAAVIATACACAQSDPQAGQQYEGPSILSRDKSLIGERGGKLIDFRFYGEVTGIYDSSLVPVSTNSSGNVANSGANYGVEAGFGVIGSKTWRRDKLSLEYRGSYRHYTTNGFFDGTDQFLNLNYAHAIKRRLYLDFKETAGTTSLSNGYFTYLPLTNTDLFAVPANELFDNRTNFLQSRVDLTYQKTARLSFGVGGEGFVVRRRSLALAGLNGYRGHADTAYRITRRQTLSANYSYSHYDFQRTFGNSNLQSVGLGYSIGLSRRWDFSLQAGAIYIHTLGLQQVTLDPAIADIVGRSTAVVVFNTSHILPLAEARLIRRFNKAEFTVGGVVGSSPGNGVYLASRQTAATASYSYLGYRKFTFSANAGYGELSALGQTIGKYRNYQAGAGATYRLVKSTHLEMRYDYRHYTTQNDLFRKNSQRVTLGLAFSPGETPIAIW
jgi:hypothetical protein